MRRLDELEHFEFNVARQRYANLGLDFEMYFEMGYSKIKMKA